TQAVQADVEKALDALRSAERPLVIIGKGMAYSRAEDEVRAFIERPRVPFLASPMGKGVMPDNHPLSVGAARSHALQNADVVFLMGARLNWIMHFGLPPRYNKNVRFIQLDIAAETIGQNAPTEVALVGDGKAIVAQINESLKKREWVYPSDTPRDTRGAGKLLPCAERRGGVDAGRRDHHRRRRQHDGHRPHAALQLEAPPPAPPGELTP